MRKIKQTLRMLWSMNLSTRAVSRGVKISRDTVEQYKLRATNANLFTWEDVASLDEAVLEEKLFPGKDQKAKSKKVLPDWATIFVELRSHKGVTLFLLWEEYVLTLTEEEAYSYSQFCSKYNDWKGKIPSVMVQHHKAGEKLFVDYAGVTVPYIDRFTVDSKNRIKYAQIFVAALGASSFTYAEAHESQKIPFWIEGHVNTFNYIEGVTAIAVPDNLKSGVTSPCYYEPEINRTYDELSLHYSFAVIPARKLKPKDKAKVEKSVQVVERRILAPLRKRTFFSLSEINAAMKPLLEKLNDRIMKHIGKSRRELFITIDKPALGPLPKYPFEECERVSATVGINYHVHYQQYYYSVPYTLIKEEVEIRATTRTIEIFSKGRRVASHLRVCSSSRYRTSDEHMPSNHRRRNEKWSPGRFIRWAAKFGNNAQELIQAVLDSKKHPEQTYKSCLGILKLSDKYGSEKLEAACKRALLTGFWNYRTVKNILKNKLEEEPLIETAEKMSTNDHENLRGSSYYN